jgi:hypothetical protein
MRDLKKPGFHFPTPPGTKPNFFCSCERQFPFELAAHYAYVMIFQTGLGSTAPFFPHRESRTAP